MNTKFKHQIRPVKKSDTPNHLKRMIVIISSTVIAVLLITMLIVLVLPHKPHTATTEKVIIAESPLDQARSAKKDFTQGETMVIAGTGFTINVNGVNEDYALQQTDSCAGYLSNPKYVLVNVTVKNVSRETQTFKGSFFDLIYTSSDNVTLGCDGGNAPPTGFIPRLVVLKPGTFLTGNLLFGIQSDASSLKLQYQYLFDDGSNFLYTIAL